MAATAFRISDFRMPTSMELTQWRAGHTSRAFLDGCDLIAVDPKLPPEDLDPIAKRLVPALGGFFRISDTETMIRSGAVSLPIVLGGTIDVIRSLTLSCHHWQMFARFETTELILIVTGNLPQIIGIYLPHLDSCLVLSREKRGSTISVCEAAVSEIRTWAAIAPDIASTWFEKPESGSSLSISNQHIGHHLWDELGGFEALRLSGALACIDHVAIAPWTTEHYDLIDGIFPEIADKVSRHETAEAFLVDVLNHDRNMVPVGHRYITQALADRITTRAFEREPAFADALRAGQGFAVTILIGLRVENRCWVDQAAGYVRLIQALADRFGKVRVIFDGHNAAANPFFSKIRSYGERRHNEVSPDESKAITAERQIASDVRDDLSHLVHSGQLEIIDTINFSVATSIIAVQLSDIFVSHWGAGLAKYKWIANKPGIVLTSNSMLSLDDNNNKSNDIRIYDDTRFRQNAVESTFIPKSIVSDFPDTIHHIIPVKGAGYRSFTLEVDHFIELTLRYISDLGSSASILPNTSNGNCKS